MAGLASLFVVPACDDSTADGADDVRLERVFSVDQSVLVCVTAIAPRELSTDTLDEVYEAWELSGESRDNYVTSYLFQFEDQPDQPTRYMFAMVFSDDPDGLAAASTHRTQEYGAFRGQLESSGFTSVSLQSSLLHIDGAPEDSHPAAH